jgi:hypothetical protein
MFAIRWSRRFANTGFFKDGEIVMPKALNDNSIGSRMFVRHCHALHGKDENSKNPLQQVDPGYQVNIVSV